MKRLTDEEFTERVYNWVGNEYTFEEPYKGNREKLLVRHNKCGHAYKVAPYAFKHGRRCPYCAHRVTLTNEQFVKSVTDKFDGAYTPLTKYIDTKHKVTMHCNICGSNWDVVPSSLVQGSGCPTCSYRKRGDARRYTKEQFVENLESKYPHEYTIVGEYKGNHVPIEAIYNHCGHIGFVEPANLLTGYGCPICKNSRGELLVAKVLDSLNIKYQAQKCFDGCKDKRVLPFDFYLPEYNTCIEYDGIQHYEPRSFGGSDEETIENYNIQKSHDAMKDKFCKTNGILLIRIPYRIKEFEDLKRILLDNIVFKTRKDRD